jgi:outer membrane lipoprotein-sorting protein
MAISGRRRITIVGLVAALAVAALGVANVRADPTPDLPPIGGDELLAAALGALARPFTISGDVDTHVDLGIPQIPAGVGGGNGGGVMGAVDLVAGDQEYKLWRSSDGARVAHLLPFGEQDVVVNRHDAWFWDSSDMSAIHLAGVPGTTLWDASAPAAAVRDADLVRFAQGMLGAVAPYADVTVEGTATVAGRSAYQLELTPTSTLTLVGRIAVAIDAETRLPLRFQVFPRGSDGAAIEAGFTSVSFDAIDPSMFAFTPPPGTTVRQAADVIADARRSSDDHTAPPVSEPHVFGRGFDLRVALLLDAPLPAEARTLLPYAGSLLSAITVERDGKAWLLVGPVSVATLEQDAASLP